MRVGDIMTSNPACCTPDSTLHRVAGLMVENDCGQIPVVGDQDARVPIGVITDRDIVCRTVARALNPMAVTVGEIMSSPCVTVTAEMPLEDCCRTMEDKQVRRVVVIDSDGGCIGIVSLADIAINAQKRETAEVLREVSVPTSASAAAWP